MRKEIKSKSKRKWIVGGGLFFGGIALLTTGFATWIVGTQIKNQQAETTVTIDTVRDETLILSVTATDDTIAIFEEKKETGFIKVEGDDAQKTDFKITLDIKIEKGEIVAKPEKLSIAIGTSEATGKKVLTAADFNADTLDAKTEYTKHEANTPYTYLDLTTEITLDPAAWTGETTYSKLHDIDLLDWGTYFGNVAPSEYYDQCGTESGITLDDPTEYREFMSEVKGELDTFVASVRGDGSKDIILPLLISVA